MSEEAFCVCGHPISQHTVREEGGIPPMKCADLHHYGDLSCRCSTFTKESVLGAALRVTKEWLKPSPEEIEETARGCYGAYAKKRAEQSDPVPPWEELDEKRRDRFRAVAVFALDIP